MRTSEGMSDWEYERKIIAQSSERQPKKKTKNIKWNNILIKKGNIHTYVI